MVLSNDNQSNLPGVSADETKWLFHRKVKTHAKNVGQHVKKHHKKYLGGFFAGFAIWKTIRLLIFVIGSAFVVSNSPSHQAAAIETSNYDGCAFQEQFCLDLAAGNSWDSKVLAICLNSGVEMVQNYQNKIIDEKAFTEWVSKNFNIDANKFISVYETYDKEICDCCKGGKIGEGCCDAKLSLCLKSNDGKYEKECNSLYKQCSLQSCGESYDKCVFEEQFCIDLARSNKWDEKQVNLCIISGEDIVGYINEGINDRIVSSFLKNFNGISSKDFVAPYNTYKEKGAICSCCNGESGQKSCCDAKEKNCMASSANTKGDDYCEQCSQLKSAHSKGPGGDGCTFDAQFCVGLYEYLAAKGAQPEDLYRFWEECTANASQIFGDYSDYGINFVMDGMANGIYGDMLKFFEFDSEMLTEYLSHQVSCDCCEGGEPNSECCEQKFAACKELFDDPLCADLLDDCESNACSAGGACSEVWRQGQYLNADFWKQWGEDNDPDKFLINALFGEGSVYTKGWDDPSGCKEKVETVVTVYSWNDFGVSLGATRLQDNTVYVLMNKELSLMSPVDMGSCSAIVSPVETQIFPTSDTFCPNGAAYIYIGSREESSYDILDNIGLSARSVEGGCQSYDGISLVAAGYTIINDVQVRGFANDGILLSSASSNNVINNIQSFGNNIGINSQGATYLSINNTQTYKNNNYGISFVSEVGLINNVLSYDNSNDGIYLRVGDGGTLINDTMSYLNGKFGLNISRGTVYLNGQDDIVCDYGEGDNISGEYTRDVYSENVGLIAGIVTDDGPCYGYDYITNPVRYQNDEVNDDEIHLYRWNHYDPIQAIGIYTISSQTIWTEQWGRILGYSYGRDIKLQSNPIIFDAADGQNLMYVDSYNACQYIGSTVNHISDGTNNLSGTIVSGNTYNVTVSSTQLGNFSLGTPSFQFWGTIEDILGRHGLGSESVTINNVNYRLITQLFGGNITGGGLYMGDNDYYATHFEKTGVGEMPVVIQRTCQSGWNNDNFLNETFWNHWATDLDKTGTLICALYGSGPNDTTAYTKYWSGWNYNSCSGMDMNVQIVSSLPATLTGNTIYVVSGSAILSNGYINMPNCTAIVGKKSLAWLGCEVSSSYGVNMGNYAILDTISLSTLGCSSAQNGIRVNSLNTLHNVLVYGYGIGIYHTVSQPYSVYLSDVTIQSNNTGLAFTNLRYSRFDNLELISNTKIGGSFSTTRNNLFNNIRTTNNTKTGLLLSNASNNTINNITGQNNGVGLILSNSSGNIVNSGWLSSNGVGISIQGGLKNEFNDIDIYDETEKHYIYDGVCGSNQNKGLDIVNSSYNKFTNLMVYNWGYGLSMNSGNYNFINNSQLYGSCFPLLLENSNRNTFNNMQIYGLDEIITVNQYKYALKFNNSNYNIIKNSLLYLPYVYLSGSNNRFVDTAILENARVNEEQNMCSLFYTGRGTNYYNGTLKIFNNYKCISPLLTQGSVISVTSSTPNLVLAAGSVNTGIKWSFDYMTNAIDGSGRYLTDWYNLYNNSNFKGRAVGYSFGSGVPVQSLPLYYSGTTLYGSGIYDTSKYIGSKVARQTGTMTVNPTTTTGNTTVKVTATTSTINKYSLFNNGFSNLAATGSNRGANTTITLTGTPGEKAIIGQIWSTNGYFATHFQKTGILQQEGNQGNGSRNCRGRDNDKFLDDSFWQSWAGNNTTGQNQIRCALYGASGGDTTAYTKYWSGWIWGNTTNGCNVSSLTVTVTTSLPSNGNLAANTIYVLNTTKYTGSNNISIPKCTAIVGRYGNTMVVSTGHRYVQSSGTAGPAYSIMDSLILQGYSLSFSVIRNSTFHKLKIKTITGTLVDTYGIVRAGSNTSYTNNVFHTIDIIGYGGGLSIDRGSNTYAPTYDIYSYMDIYAANTGINLTNTKYNLFNNIHVHDNKIDGIRINNNVAYNTFNNMHIHNNLYCGIIGSGVSNSSNNVFNNIQTYNHSQIGLTLHGMTDNIINNVSSYNNLIEGIYSDSTTNKYYGNNYITNTATPYQGITQGSANGLFSQGNITGFNLTWDYITNPRIATGYVLEWTGKFSSLTWQYNGNGTSTFKSGYALVYGRRNDILGYSYGVNIKTQTKPMKYNGTTLTWFDDVNYYDTGNYIGSDVKRIPGSAAISCDRDDGLVVGFDNGIDRVSLCSSSNDILRLADKVGGGGGGGRIDPNPPIPSWGYYTCTITGYSTQTGVAGKFSVYPLFTGRYLSGTTVGYGTGLSNFESDPGINNFVTQIWGSSYFATHFQGENNGQSTLSCLAGWDNSKFLSNAFWNAWEGDNDIGHQQIKCALYGGYSGNTTAYTKGWTGWQWGNTANGCNVMDMNVVVTGVLQGGTLAANTIYVLTTGKVISSNYIIMDNCNAIVSKSGTILYTSSNKNYGIYSNSKKFGILDNLSIDGNHNGNGGNITAHLQGILFTGVTKNTLNNIKSYNNSYRGIELVRSSNNVLNNIQTYNNAGEGLRLQSSSHNNSINNMQSYNNVTAISLSNANGNILNNIQAYNNTYGLSLSTVAGNIFNDFSIYNNQSTTASVSNSTNNKYYGYLRIFGNGGSNTIPSGLTAGAQSDYSNLGWTGGRYTSEGTMSRDFVMNVKDANGYMLPWTGNYANLRGVKTLGQVTEYSYGMWINPQLWLVVYDNTNTLEVLNSYSGAQFIGGDTRRAEGSGQRLSCYFDQGSQKDVCTYVGNSTASFIANYKVFVLDAATVSQTKSIGSNTTATGINISQMSYVVQLEPNTLDMATHFENDGMPPTVTLTTNMPACVKGGVAYTMTGTWSEEMSGFDISDISKSPAGVTLSSNFTTSNNPIFAWTVTSPSSGTGVASITIDTGVAEDLGGNPNSRTGISWEYDSAKPVTTPTITPSNYSCTSGDVTFTFGVTDDGCATGTTTYRRAYTSNSGTPTTVGTSLTVSTGAGGYIKRYVRYYSKDTLGNSETVQSKTVQIDKAGPNAPTGLAGGGCVGTATPGLSWTAPSDVGCSATIGGYEAWVCTTAACSSATKSGTPTSTSWTVPSGLSNGTTYYRKVRAKDGLGNWGNWSEIGSFTIDSSAPNQPTITAISPDCGTGTSINVSSTTVSDVGCDGSVQYQFCRTTSTTATNCTNSDWSDNASATFNGLNNGTKYYFFVRTKDGLGNISSWTGRTLYTVDTSGPNKPTNLTETPKTGNDTTPKLSWTAPSDVGCSSISGYVVEVSTTTNFSSITRTWTGSATSWDVSGALPGTAGQKYYWRVKAQDALGNWGGTETGWFYLDTISPTCTIKQAACTSGTLILTLTGSENIGTPSGWSKTNDTTYTLGVTTNNAINVTVTDIAGNTGSCSITPTNYDNIAPTTTASGVPSGWTGTDVTVTLSADSNGCNSTNTTYYCVYDSGSSACTPSTAGTSVSVTCASNSVCQKYVRYYSKDGLGNTESTKTTDVIMIDKKGPSMIFTGATPADNIWQNFNYFTGQIDITESNLRIFNWLRNGNISQNMESNFASGLILYYKFDKNQAEGETDTVIKDYSGKGNTGTVNGSIWITGGKVNGAYKFRGSGSSDYIKTTSAEVQSVFGTSTNFTVSARVNATKFENYSTIIGEGNAGAYWASASFGLRSYSDGYTCILGTHASQNTSTTYKKTAAYKPTTNAWHNVMCVVEGTTMAMYVDGAQVSSVSISGIGTRTVGNNGVYIGKHTYYNTFTGSIDEVRVYDRSLQTSEISDYYNSTKGGYGIYDDSLVLMYNFDNVSGLGESNTLVKDMSRYGNDGTISSTSTVVYTGDGKWGGAYDFKGGKITAGNNESLRSTGNFTVSLRVKSNTQNTNNQYFLSRWNAGSTKRVWALTVAGGSRNLNLSFSTNGSSQAGNSIAGGTVADGVWHFVVLTHDGNNIKLYLDGVLKGSKANTGLYYANANLIAGSLESGNPFNGQLDEIRMYNRALSSQEIETLYRSNLAKVSLEKWTFTISYTGLADGTYVYGGAVTDMVGLNTSISRTLNIDTTPPSKPTFVLPYVNGGGEHTNGNWANKQFRSDITTTELNTVSQIQWKKGNGSWSTLAGATSRLTANGMVWTTYEPWTDTDGRNDTVYFRAIDAVGNISEVSEAMYVRYDKTAPVVALSGVGSPSYANSGTEITIYLKITDTVSGINTGDFAIGDLSFKVGNTTVTPSTKTLTWQSTTAGVSLYKLVLKGVTGNGALSVISATGAVVDNAGNDSARKTLTPSVTIDNINPTCTIAQSPTTPTSGNVTLTATVTETNKSGYSWTGWNNLVGTQTTFVTGSNGTRTFYVQDKALNTGTCQITISNIDKTAPAAPTCTANACYSGSKSVTCSTTSSDGTVRYTTDGTTPTCSSAAWSDRSFSSTTTLKVIACDPAFNYSSVNTYIYTADNTAPNVPTMVTEPPFTPGLTNSVASSVVSDNGCNGNVEYQFCMKTEATMMSGGAINEALQNLGGGSAEGIERTDTAPGAKAPNIVELGEKKGEVQAWYEKGIIYIYTTNSVLKLPADSSNMFASMKAVKSIDLGEIDTSGVENMEGMFRGDINLSELDLSQFDTSKVINMNSMFDGDNGLQTIYASDRFVVGEKVSSDNMFKGCTSLVGGDGTVYSSKYIDATYARIDKLPKTPGYFTEKLNGQTKSSTLIGGSEFNQVMTNLIQKNKVSSFERSDKLPDKCELSSWEDCGSQISDKSSEMTIIARYDNGVIYYYTQTDNIYMNANAGGMFSGLGFVSIDLGAIDTSKVTNMDEMFKGDKRLQTIYASDKFVVGEKVEGKNMFEGCSSLVGGDGTVYSSKYIDATYARIDKLPKSPGYFTESKGGGTPKGGAKGPTASDDGFGCDQVTDWLSVSGTTFTSLTDGTLYGYYVRSRDGLGNTSVWSSPTTSTQDNTRPSIRFDKNSGAAAKAHSVVVTASDDTAGLAASQKIRYRWQTGSICSTTASQYSTGVLSPTTAGTHSAAVTVTTEGLSDGSYYLCILSGTVSDQVGNKNILAQTNGVFIVDNTNPSVSATKSSTAWKTSNITSIKMLASDGGGAGLSGAKYYWTGNANVTLAQCWAKGTGYSSGTTTSKTTNGIQYLHLCAYDNAGNTAVWSGTYKLDKTAPSVGMTNSSTNWKTGNISIKLTASDATSGLSGSAKYYWTGVTTATLAQCWEGGTEYSSGTNITDSIEGIRYLYVCAYDVAGNSKVVSGTYKLDKADPVITVTDASTACAASKTVKATITDATAGVNTRKYVKTGSATCNANTTNWSNATTYTDGSNITLNAESDNGKYICFQAVDNAGRTSYKASSQITGIDVNGPGTPTLSSPEDNYTTNNRTPTLTWTAGTIAGCSAFSYYEIQVCKDTGCENVEQSKTGSSTSRTLTEQLSALDHYWRVRERDSLGRYSDWTNVRKITIDTTDLTCSITQLLCTSGNLTLTLTSNKEITSISDGWTRVDETTYTKIVTSNDYVSATIGDIAGNTGSCNMTPTNYDNQAPVTTASGIPTGWTGNNVIVTLTPSTDHGCNIVNTTYYCIYDSGSSACNPTTVGTSVNVECAAGSVCQKYIRYYSKDGLGNTESIKTGLVKIDKKPPVCGNTVYTPSSWTNLGVSARVRADDDGAGLQTTSPQNTGFVTNGEKTITFVDNVGNSQDCNLYVSWIDQNKPSCTVYVQPTKPYIGKVAGYDTGTVTFKCSDPIGINTFTLTSGAILHDNQVVTLSNNAVTGTVAGDITYSFVYTARDAGSTTFQLKSGFVFDIALNPNDPSSVSNTVVVDITKPTLTVTPNTTGCTNSTVSHMVTYSDGGAGINTGSLQYSYDNYTWHNPSSAVPGISSHTESRNNERNSTVYRKVCDKVGNCASTGGIAIKIDKTAPTVTGNNAVGLESTRITGSVLASDNSGYCNTLRYYWTGEVGSGNTTASYGAFEDEPMTKTSYVRVTDAAGNSTVKTVIYTWTNTGPVNPTITNDSPKAEGKDIIFTGSAVDTGNTTWKYQWYDSANCTNAITGATGKSYTKKLIDAGTYTVSLKVSDNQGSGSVCVSSTATWTNEKPKGSISNNGPKVECDKVTYIFTGTDAGGGNLKYRLYEGNKCTGTPIRQEDNIPSGVSRKYEKVLNVVGNYVISFEVIDENNESSTCVTSTGEWIDAVLSITTPYNIGLLTGTKTINNLASASAFNATGYGACETVTVTKGTCTNADISESNGNITITPNPNTSGSGSCMVRFTDGDTVQTGVIEFNIQTLVPIVVFTGSSGLQVNPASPTVACVDRNRFLTKMKIEDSPNLGDFTYSITENIGGSTSTSLYDLYNTGLLAMYNFDNIDSLGDDWVNGDISHVHDVSPYGVHPLRAMNVTWSNDGLWGGAYKFNPNEYAHIEGTDPMDYNLSSMMANNGAISVWIKTKLTSTYQIVLGIHSGLAIGLNNSKIIGVTSPLSNSGGVVAGYDNNGWNHIVVSMSGGKMSYYINGIKLDNTTNDSLVWSGGNSGGHLTIGRRPDVSSYSSFPFSGQIDELRIYNHPLTQDEVQFLYRSNLARTSTGEWLFQTLNTCLAPEGTYTYTGTAKSLYGYTSSQSAKVSMCIPDVSFTGGMDVDFGTYDVTDVEYTVSSGYLVNIQVDDWRAKNGWTGSVRISSNFSGQHAAGLYISSSGFRMKTNSIEDLGHYMLGYVPEYATGLVQLSPVLTNFSQIITYQGANQGTPYFVANYPEGDFMCNGGTYGDKPQLQLDIPAWQPGDDYVANIYWTIEP